MWLKFIGLADYFIPSKVVKNPELQSLARRYQAVSRMLCTIIINMWIFTTPLVIFGEKASSMPLIMVAITICVFLGLITMRLFQSFIGPLLIAIIGTVGFMLYGMTITGGISSPFLFMIMALPVVTITFGDSIIFITLCIAIALSIAAIYLAQSLGVVSFPQIEHFTAFEQLLSLTGAFSLSTFGGILAKKEINRGRNALRHARETAMQEARIDLLTNLLNRRAFIEDAGKMINRVERNHSKNEQLFIAMIDIDFFKQVNDTYGHSVGDTVLIEVAKSLKEATRKFEIVARLGGEEFVLLFESNDVDGALQVGERLRTNVADHHTIINEKDINVTISIGICSWRMGDSLDILLQNADKALYSAKDTGRNRVVFQSRD